MKKILIITYTFLLSVAANALGECADSLQNNISNENPSAARIGEGTGTCIKDRIAPNGLNRDTMVDLINLESIKNHLSTRSPLERALLLQKINELVDAANTEE